MTELVLAPRGELFESPASWVSRVALSQGADLREVLKVLRLTSNDPDLELWRPDRLAVARSLGLEPERLHVAHQVFSNFRRAELDPRRFLLFDGKLPWYRFCPMCLASWPLATIPVHWRFAAWRICPEHDCFMRERCAQCGARLVLPANMLLAGPDKEGIAFLSRCMHCGSLLSQAPCLARSNFGLKRWEADLVANGRALLSALYFGEVLIGSDTRRHGVARLSELDRHGMLPNRPSFLNVESIMERLAPVAR